jgi:tripartite-type tricarboxylate transporter receptor subunit TctC
MTRRYAGCAAAVIVATLSAAADAGAQTDYPSRTIRLIVPFTSGGGVDIVGRSIAQKMSENMGQPIVIDNRAGAGSNIGIAAAARAVPDGYTLVIVSSAMTINPSIYKSLPYDPVRDFAPLSRTSVIPLVLVAHPSVPARSVRELTALAKTPGQQLTYASAGIGNSTHLAMELFNFMTRVAMVHVPYKSTAQKNMDVMSGQVDLMFAAIPSTAPLVKEGRMRALAVSGQRRSPVLSDVPTIAESGVAGYEFVSWNGMLAPAGTPAAIVARLSEEIGKALAHADLRARLAADGAEPAPNSPGQFAAYIKEEIAKYARLVAAAGIPRE